MVKTFFFFLVQSNWADVMDSELHSSLRRFSDRFAWKKGHEGTLAILCRRLTLTLPEEPVVIFSRLGNPGKPGMKGREGLIGKAGPRGHKGQRGSPGLAGKRGQKGNGGDAGPRGEPGGCDCGSGARSAFSVAVSKSYPKERMPIPFSRILLNEGNHYNASSGKFVCAIPGIYYFTYDITVANRHLAIGLVHNGQYKIKTFDANTGNHDVASGSTVLHLQHLDQVWLQIFYSDQNGLFFDPFWTDSTFTGFLIYADQAAATPSVQGAS
ncbi:complement C1q tumor necrosis factor-related protein 2-like isoform X2 [Entelurus aequoreus]|uniref:complement C1q tumor necrosis factor-related protein 2-like isoform X2 n=1 Tax=Entelurus aequoreus TaxID=161455 RepID=UPI002B1DCF22|nr:complement C1q tumor necrosis factor-related protein 2-like isoform X2 [Entelurus aequoreus]